MKMGMGRPLTMAAGAAVVLASAMAGIGQGQVRVGGPGESLRQSLLKLDAVRKELDLRPAQIEKIARAGESIQSTKKQLEAESKAQPKAAANDPVAKAAEDRRKQAFEATLTEFEREGDKALAAILDPRQRTRLDQIAWQIEGPWAFLDPQIIRGVRLSETQVLTVQEVLGLVRQSQEQYKQQRKQSKDAAKDLGSFALEGMRKDQEKSQARSQAYKAAKQALPTILRHLDRRQRDLYERMLGEPFDMAGLTDPGGAPLFAEVGLGASLVKQASVQDDLKLNADQRQKIADGEPAAKVLDARQSARLDQIILQGEGPSIFLRPDMVRALRLTEDQVARVQEVLGGVRDEHKAIRDALKGAAPPPGPGVDPEREAARKEQEKAQVRAASATLNDRTMPRVEAILTRAQRAALQKRLGEPFDFTTIRAAPRPDPAKAGP